MRTVLPPLLLTALLSAAAPPAGPAPDTAGLEAMKAVSFLAGRWEGEGWMKQGPGEPQHFKSVEMVEAKLEGRLLVVEGLHHAGTPERIVHHAFAVISAQPAGGYRFQSYLADGRSTDARGELSGGAFVWTLENPQAGRIRYTIRVSGDQWLEVGELSRDGTTWNQVFEMKLTRRR